MKGKGGAGAVAMGKALLSNFTPGKADLTRILMRMMMRVLMTMILKIMSTLYK